MQMTYREDMHVAYSSVRKQELCLARGGTDITDSADGWAHLKQEYMTLESSRVLEEGKQVLGRNRDMEEVQLDEGIMNRREVKLVSASFL